MVIIRRNILYRGKNQKEYIYRGNNEPRYVHYDSFTFIEASEPATSDEIESDDDSLSSSRSESPGYDPFS